MTQSTLARSAAFAAIDSERDYQDALTPERTSGEDHTVGDYITMLQQYQNEAVQAWTKNAGDDAALEIVRKIAGIAVRCMEEHGAPLRETS